MVPRYDHVPDWVRSGTWQWSNWLGGRLLHNTTPPLLHMKLSEVRIKQVHVQKLCMTMFA